MNIKVGDRVRFTALDWYGINCIQDSGKIVTVVYYDRQSNLYHIEVKNSAVWNGTRAYVWHVRECTLSPINIQGKQLTFSFME